MEEKIIKQTKNGQKVKLPRVQRTKSVDLRRLIDELEWAPKYSGKLKTRGKDLIFVLKPKLECLLYHPAGSVYTEKAQSSKAMGGIPVEIEVELRNVGSGPSYMAYIELYDGEQTGGWGTWESLRHYTLQDRKSVTIMAAQEILIRDMMWTPKQDHGILLVIGYDLLFDPRNANTPTPDNPHCSVARYVS